MPKSHVKFNRCFKTCKCRNGPIRFGSWASGSQSRLNIFPRRIHITGSSRLIFASWSVAPNWRVSVVSSVHTQPDFTTLQVQNLRQQRILVANTINQLLVYHQRITVAEHGFELPGYGDRDDYLRCAHNLHRDVHGFRTDNGQQNHTILRALPTKVGENVSPFGFFVVWRLWRSLFSVEEWFFLAILEGIVRRWAAVIHFVLLSSFSRNACCFWKNTKFSNEQLFKNVCSLFNVEFLNMVISWLMVITYIKHIDFQKHR